MASSEWGGGGELLSLPLPFFFYIGEGVLVKVTTAGLQ